MNADRFADLPVKLTPPRFSKALSKPHNLRQHEITVSMILCFACATDALFTFAPTMADFFAQRMSAQARSGRSRATL